MVIANDLAGYAKAVDDLFSPKPMYLPDRCPHCNHDHAYRLSDSGERIRTPALSISIEHGAKCARCHDVWEPSELVFLGKLLGYRGPAGVIG